MVLPVALVCAVLFGGVVAVAINRLTKSKCLGKSRQILSNANDEICENISIAASKYIIERGSHDDPPHSEMLQRTGWFVVEILEACDVPRCDLFSPSDPFVEGYISAIQNNAFKRVSGIFSTPVKWNNDHPIWHHFANLECFPPDNGVLTLCLYDSDFEDTQALHRKTLLGSVRIPIDRLAESPSTFPMQFHQFGSPDKNPNFSISLRRAFLDTAPPDRVTFFIIRHGQSTWHRADEEQDMSALLALDHPLSPEGARQAMKLAAFWQRFRDPAPPHAPPEPAPPAGAAASAEDEDAERRAALLRAFARADAVFSSPLTRAVQTALVALADHPALARRPLTLWAGLREVKTGGGLDAVGVATGPAIAERARAELAAAVGTEAAERISGAETDFADCARPWWTPAAASESLAEQRARARAWLDHARYNGAAAAVYVAHALLFRRALGDFASPGLARRRPELARRLRESKLGYAALAAVEVSYPRGGGGAAVEDVVLLHGCLLPA